MAKKLDSFILNALSVVLVMNYWLTSFTVVIAMDDSYVSDTMTRHSCRDAQLVIRLVQLLLCVSISTVSFLTHSRRKGLYKARKSKCTDLLKKTIERWFTLSWLEKCCHFFIELIGRPHRLNKELIFQAALALLVFKLVMKPVCSSIMHVCYTMRTCTH